MEHTRKIRKTLEEALALSRRALYEDALTHLDRALMDARQAQDRRAVVVFARNAGIISSGEGDFQRAMTYYSEALENGPDDLYMRIALADVHQRLGHDEAARKLLSECRQTALLEGDEDILTLLRAQEIDSRPDRS